MELTPKYRKRLSNDKWYHATTMDQLDSLKDKIDCTYNMGTELDFGAGFYLTNSLQAACNYIQRQKLKTTPEEQDTMIGTLDSFLSMDIQNDTTDIVLEFHIPNLIEIFEDDSYNTCIFGTYNDAFAKFVFDNRENPSTLRHTYDFTYGVQTDSNPTDLMLRYKNDEMSKDDILQALQKSTSVKQLCLHNQAFCDILKISKGYIVETREEINIYAN